MEKAKQGKIAVHVSMSAYQRDLIDFRARTTGMSRSEFIVQAAAYGKVGFRLDLDSMTKRQKAVYRTYHRDSPTVGYMERSEGTKPRKAEDNRVRSEYVRMRVSPFEKEALRKLAYDVGMSMTDYLLLCTIYSPPPASNALNRKELRDLFVELRAQGRNLNQLTAAANRIAAIAWRDDVDGGLIDQLCRELLEDNDRTRAMVNDATRKVADLIAESSFRDGVRDGRCDGDA